jgi:hypothetical protein
MLMHTRGILVMTPESAMVLTGKTSLDYSGGVSAEDNHGIGGYERVMGPNGQAQYWAPDLAGACRVLLDYYQHAYVAPGERFPRPARTTDPVERDVRSAPHRLAGSDLARVGDVFSDATNPDRKKPFDIRSVMRAVIDADHPPLERWAPMRDAEVAVVWDAHLGGHPVALLGIESHPLPRHGMVPADGPESWTSGTLFPRASKKIARAINAVAGRRPLVVLANLAGFDGSPESMRRWQLEFGAEIGRAVVNFDGPIVFCVISRYHGGASVVFSQKLNDRPDSRTGGRARVGDRRRARGRRRPRARGPAGRRARRADHHARRANRRRGRRRARPPAHRARDAVGDRPLRAPARAGQRVRRRPQRGARGPRGLGERDRRPGGAASVPHRGRAARHSARWIACPPMTALSWLTCERTDVAPGDVWLGPTERRVQTGIRAPS